MTCTSHHRSRVRARPCALRFFLAWFWVICKVIKDSCEDLSLLDPVKGYNLL